MQRKPHHREPQKTAEELEQELEAIEAANKKAAQLLQQLKNDRIKLMKMPEFRRVMAAIMAQGGLFTSVMTGNSQTFYLSGKQDFCRQIWSDLAEADQKGAFGLLTPKLENSDG